MARSTVHYTDKKTIYALMKLRNKLGIAGTPVQRVDYVNESLLLRIFEIKLRLGVIFIILCFIAFHNQDIMAQESVMRKKKDKTEEIKGYIQFNNPSFEDYPQAGHTPREWLDGGFFEESPVDIQPTPAFKVTQEAYHGDSYVGMVVRDINTWERVGQKLNTPIEKGYCYSFSAYLMCSPTYESMSQLTRKTVNYNNPTILRVWGSNSAMSDIELLAESPVVGNRKWKKFDFVFYPKKKWDHIFFEVYYVPDTSTPYNGNLLMDNLSKLKVCRGDNAKQ